MYKLGVKKQQQLKGNHYLFIYFFIILSQETSFRSLLYCLHIFVKTKQFIIYSRKIGYTRF